MIFVLHHQCQRFRGGATESTVSCITTHSGNLVAYAGKAMMQDYKPFRGCIGMADVEYRNAHYGRRITTYPTRERLKNHD